MIAPVLPGCMVRNKRNMNVSLWSDYTSRECEDGKTRYQMRTQLSRWLVEPALVVSVLGTGFRDGTGVTMLFVPSLQRFCYAWANSLVVL